MDTKVNYTLVGLIGFILIAVFIAAMIWFSHGGNQRNYNTYVSIFKQDVAGLRKQSLVRLNGIKVGFVSDIALVDNDMQKVRVTMKIKKTIHVTTSTYTIIKSEGITGNEYVALDAKSATGPTLTKKPGQRYAVIPSEASLLTDVEDTLKGTSTELKTLIARINDLLKQNNRQAINQSLANIAKLTSALAKNSDNIDKSLVSAQNLLKNASAASNQFPQLVNEASTTLAHFKRLSINLDQASNNASRTIDRTNVLVQNVSDQLVPNAQTLLKRLNIMLSTLSQFGSELSQNPSILIRGKAPSAPGPGEK